MLKAHCVFSSRSKVLIEVMSSLFEMVNVYVKEHCIIPVVCHYYFFSVQ